MGSQRIVSFIPLRHAALKTFLALHPWAYKKCMNFGHPETSLEVEDWKVYDVCGRHQDLEPMSQYNKSQKGDQKGKALWN